MTSPGQLAVLPLFFCQLQAFDAIETEQDIERAKASVNVKVQSSVMQCETAAERALSVCVCVSARLCGEITKFTLIAPTGLL